VTSSDAVATAYSLGAESWGEGPSRIYTRLAEMLVAASPRSLGGLVVLDLGSGTGLGSRAALAAGASVIAADIALGMLLAGRASRPPAAVADATALPFRAGSFDVVLAPFSLNHLDEPSAGVREAARVLRHEGVLLASTYATDDDHPAKSVVEQALREVGWEAPTWYSSMKAAMASWGTVEAATAAIERGGMTPELVERREVSFADLTPLDLVAWRMGMAQTAPFVARLGEHERAAVFERAQSLLGANPAPLVRRVIFVVAR
jgi:SAM-dependent methyltransferase